MTADLVTLNAAMLVYFWYRGDADGLGLPPATPLDWGILWLRPHWFLILSGLWLITAHAFDAYRLQVARSWMRSVSNVVKALALTLVVYSVIPYVTPTLPPSRRYGFALFILPLAALLISRALYAWALARESFRRPTLILGAGWAGRTIADVLLTEDDGTHQIVGFVDDDDDLQGQRVPVLHERGEGSAVAAIDRRALTVLGDFTELRQLIAKHQVRTLVLALTEEYSPEQFRVLAACLELGVEIVPMARLHEQLTGRVPVEHVGGDWHVAMPIEHPGTGTLRPIANRVLDVVLALTGLLLLALATPFIALAIRVESRGPVFYTQDRIGKGGKTFSVYKFRSMRTGAEEDSAVWSQPGDPRITRVGRILRATHVDEFPQFLNILRGEMSAVGPRPERPEFLEELIAEIPFYTVRHAVRPGMAGWALVNHGYGSTVRDAQLKLQYDLYYIKHQSVWLDVVIILKTVLHSVGLRGR